MRIQKALHRVRVPKGLALPEYLFYAIVLACELGYIRKHFTGTTIKHLTGAGLSNVEIPLCPSIDEQTIIVQQIEASFSHIQALKEEIDAELQRSNALRQSILKQAFSGQLVAQDPMDEPASELLKRIRAERAKTIASKPERKTKKIRKVKETAR
jgi:type I restriction enzyme S subunit